MHNNLNYNELLHSNLNSLPLSQQLQIAINNLETNWKPLANFCLNESLNKVSLANKLLNLYQTSAPDTIRPYLVDVFNAFVQPLKEIKVVIIGQDPYPSDHAHGLAFSSCMPDKVPASLQNIFKSLQYSYGETYKPNIYGVANLTPWVKQGVLLLNTRLTVDIGNPLDPKHDIWQEFINEVFQILKLQKNIVYLLWGKYAQSFKKLINNEDNLILETSHPSPLSAYRGFLTSNCFKDCNNYLISKGISPIKW